MSVDDITAKPNPFGFEPWQPVPGLDEDSSKVPTEPSSTNKQPTEKIIVKEPLSEASQKFAQIYDQLAEAEKAGKAEVYVLALDNLVREMSREVIANHRSHRGDLHHTMAEWEQRNKYLISENGEKLQAGQNITRRSNTLNNSHSPHGTGSYLGDRTDSVNSQMFGGHVVEYLAQRGGGYIKGSVVPGESERQEPHSVYQVQSEVKGFNQPRFRYTVEKN